jgi:hypothetical protein
MGHKLGDNSKTTYIQVNSLSNKLFVEEYAAPVFEMLEKYVLYSEDELTKLAAENEKTMANLDNFITEEIQEGLSKREASIAYMIKTYLESKESEKNNIAKRNDFDRI